jgi:hypothetical protein
MRVSTGTLISDFFRRYGESLPAKAIPEIIAVAGPSRSGSSCVAGVLDALGVPMGESAFRPNRKNPKGFFEDRDIVLFNRLYCRGRSSPSGRTAERVAYLTRWMAVRSRDGKVVGCKQRCLGISVPDMVAAWPRLKVITTSRPTEDIVASMRRVGWGAGDERRRRVDAEIKRRDEDLGRLGVPTMRVEYADILRDTRAVVEQIVAFVGIERDPEAIQRAMAFVEPALNHFTKVEDD